MNEPAFEEMLNELRKIRSTMATKAELKEIRSTMATKAELEEIRSTMATKAELEEIRSTMATKAELEEIRSMMATKDEMGKGFADLKKTLSEYHSENISVDEKLLEGIRTTNDKLEQNVKRNQEQFNTHEYSIDILHRKQLMLETEIEKIKNH